MAKLTLRHLEVLIKLAINEKPIHHSQFNLYLSQIMDLIDAGLIKEKERYYQITEKGKTYFEKVLHNASNYLEKNMNSNQLLL